MMDRTERSNLLSYRKEIREGPSYDVIVAGAGPAGICAAVAAARQGARVALIERYGVLGGNLTAGHIGPILGMVGSGTMRDELLALLGVANNDMLGEVGVAHDVECAKRVLAEFIDDTAIDVYLQTVIVDALMVEGHVGGVVVSTKEGLLALRGAVVVDATGDGDVAFFAGAAFEQGREDGLVQPVSHEFTIADVDETRAIVCIGDVDDVELDGERFLDFCARCGQEGILPGDLVAVRLHRTTKPGERQVNTTQVGGVDSTQVRQLYPAELALRRQIAQLVDFFREHLPGYENCKCIASGATLGVRESRRFLGEYVITAEDLAAGRRFEDVVVHKAEFIVDIHNPDGPGQAEAEIQYVVPYDLPYRCFVPEKLDGLLLAGRCISGTHRAHASYRVMSICMAMGQAIGTAAAICAKQKCMPRALDVAELQRVLTEAGIDLFSA